MTSETKLKDAATKAAEALQEEWSIGTHSQYCDDATDFDAAETEEIAAIIRRCYGEGESPDSRAPSGRLHPMVSFAGFYGINPFITFEDVWPFGDPRDVGKLKPDLEDQLIAAELKRRGIDTETSFKAVHAMLDAHIAKANAEARHGER